MFFMNGLIKHVELDTYQQGCIDDPTNHSMNVDVMFKAETLKGLLDKVSEFIGCYDYQINPCGDDPSRVDWQLTVDENTYPASQSDLQLWRKGKKRLWIADFTGFVERSNTVNIEQELKQ